MVRTCLFTDKCSQHSATSVPSLCGTGGISAIAGIWEVCSVYDCLLSAAPVVSVPLHPSQQQESESAPKPGVMRYELLSHSAVLSTGGGDGDWLAPLAGSSYINCPDMDDVAFPWLQLNHTLAGGNRHDGS